MPLFGKRPKQSVPNTKLVISKSWTGKSAPMRFRPNFDHYNVLGTTLKTTNSRLERRLIKSVEVLKRKKPNAVIVEWGAGDGTAIKELAERYPSMRFIGTSEESHKEWTTNNPKNLSYLHTNHLAIAKLASRKSVKGKVDIIYSHYGLYHLGIKNPRKLINHLYSLSEALCKGGKIILRPGEIIPLDRLQSEYKIWDLMKEKLEEKYELVFSNTVNVVGFPGQYLVELIKK